jgi:hypothetical protein
VKEENEKNKQDSELKYHARTRDLIKDASKSSRVTLLPFGRLNSVRRTQNHVSARRSRTVRVFEGLLLAK